ncbi:tetratricopeptide repeat protein [Phytohabitans sp. ZYX-F-186]|uniref:Tetratricopeptide repeat protein n=1 Tax=Phytohabitans maris TaxID=3071409 RepID=A0ABU0ZMP6_9ACTN|nr:tetratricopeptide repeat protein [Phytohabitans sp. ZYX-F-186]MDQ7908313.1 tetratricopeptide repeat protein [Phytohabitans sp. ZYX-F-186]
MTVNEPLDDQHRSVARYHQLGLAAQAQGDLDTAEQWYQRALAGAEQLDDQTDVDISCFQLGFVAHARGDLDAAEHWYQRGLTTAERRGDQASTAAYHHHLGIVAQDRGELDAAGERLERARAIREQLADVPRLAMTYGQLGLLALRRDAPVVALEWTIRCAALFPSFPHRAAGPAPWNLAQLTEKLGWDALHAAWRRVTGEATPASVVETIRAIQAGRARESGPG